MHLTLSFLGEIDAAQCAAVVACLDALVLGPVTLATEQVGLTVQAHGRVVVWVAVKCPEEFRGAIAQLENRMREIPIAALAKAKPFQPHITLARLKNVRRVGALRKAVENIKLPECAWTAQAITLHQSELRPDGPIYTELHKKTL